MTMFHMGRNVPDCAATGYTNCEKGYLIHEITVEWYTCSIGI